MPAAVGAGTLRQGWLTGDDGAGEAQQHKRGQRCVGHDCAAGAERAGGGACRGRGAPSSAATTPPTRGGGVEPARGRTAGTLRFPAGWHAADSNFSPLKINFPFELK